MLLFLFKWKREEYGLYSDINDTDVGKEAGKHSSVELGILWILIKRQLFMMGCCQNIAFIRDSEFLLAPWSSSGQEKQSWAEGLQRVNASFFFFFHFEISNYFIFNDFFYKQNQYFCWLSQFACRNSRTLFWSLVWSGLWYGAKCHSAASVCPSGSQYWNNNTMYW